MKQLCKRTSALFLCLLFTFGTTGASASTDIVPAPEQYIDGFVDVLAPSLARGLSLPKTAWDLGSSIYKGEIQNISKGYGVYTSYYFTCGSNGKLKVDGTFKSEYGGNQAQVRIEIWDVVQNMRVKTYNTPKGVYQEGQYDWNVFTGLSAGTAYAVRFYNNSTSDFENKISGPISVSRPA